MYEMLPEYLVNADLFYRLWMVAEMQNPQNQPASTKMNTNMVKAREDWHPELVALFDDVRMVPGVIRVQFPEHQLNSSYEFHTGSRKPTIHVEEMELFWGVASRDVVNNQVIPNPLRTEGPAKVVISDMRMWHFEDQLHRRRGDSVIVNQADFYWNEKTNSNGLLREDGPFQVTIKGFRAQHKMGVCTHAQYDSINVSWATHSKGRIGEDRVAEVLKKNNIKYNYLLAGDTVFMDEGESFIFWDEVARDAD